MLKDTTKELYDRNTKSGSEGFLLTRLIKLVGLTGFEPATP